MLEGGGELSSPSHAGPCCPTACPHQGLQDLSRAHLSEVWTWGQQFPAPDAAQLMHQVSIQRYLCLRIPAARAVPWALCGTRM